MRRDHLPGPATLGFLLRALGWFALIFGVTRIAWVERHLLVPYAGILAGLAAGGRPAPGVVVDQSCTGADAMALCLGVVLAFPASWRRRLAGAAGGLALIAVANVLRIATLSAVVDDRPLFELLHLRLWPAALIVLTAGFVFLWMRWASAPATAAAPRPAATAPVWRFLAWTLVLVAAYYAVHDRLLASAALLEVARFAAAAASVVIGAFGGTAEVSENYLRTAYGSWVVTPECVTTPLIPVYLAAALAAPLARRSRALALALAAPLFTLLATLRLLVLALPQAVVGSHFVAVHAFYQLVVAVALVAWFATREAPADAPRRGEGRERRAARGLALGAAAAVVAGAADAFALRPLAAGALLPELHLGHGAADEQGVTTFLLAFEVGLFVALARAAGASLGGRRLAGAAAVALVALATTAVLGELATHLGFEAPAVWIRAWALAVPAVAAWLTATFRPPIAFETRTPRLARAG